ncbi:MAG: DNA mismatch repair endonuclease MutL [Salinigranum sp.]
MTDDDRERGDPPEASESGASTGDDRPETDDDRPEIRPLDERTIQHIAAGEVVERPASVVKELVENSLDADASRVSVAVERGGTEGVVVRDDGRGMTEAEVRLAVQEHTTSKIRDVEDLDGGVATLGFRGEALSTIGAVSRTTIRTRPRDGSDVGTELRIEGGDVTEVGPAGCPEGTTVEVSDLFFNTPARRKFLKTVPTEFDHVNAVVTHYALANPDVAVSLEHDGREVFATEGRGSLESTVLSVYGREVAESMVPVEFEPDDVDAANAAAPEPSEVADADAEALDPSGAADAGSEEPDPPVAAVSGLVSHPETNRSGRDYLSTFVNGRYVTAGVLREAVLDAYGGQLAPDRYPFAVLFVDVPPGTVDVNVHPRKMEVRFDDEEAVSDAVERAVESALLEAGLVRSSAPRGRSAPGEASVLPERSDRPAGSDAVDAGDADASGSDAVDEVAPDPIASDADETALDGHPTAVDESPPDGASPPGTAVDGASPSSDPVDGLWPGDSTADPDASAVEDGPADGPDAGFDDAAPDATVDADTTIEADDGATASTGSAPAESGSPGGDGTAAGSGSTGSEHAGIAPDRDQSDDGLAPDRGERDVDRQRGVDADAGGAFAPPTTQRTLAGGEATVDPDFERLPRMRVLGQLFDTYLVAETDDGLVLVDQHAADERVNYERLRAEVAGETPTQGLASPVELELTAREAALFEEYDEALARVGFRAERAGERTVEVRTVPAVVDAALDPELLRDALGSFVEARDGGRETVDAVADSLLADLACYPSITGNTSLREGSVLDLLEALDDCENPYACPHGRPVIIEFDREDIEDRFERDYPGHAGRRRE